MYFKPVMRENKSHDYQESKIKIPLLLSISNGHFSYAVLPSAVPIRQTTTKQQRGMVCKAETSRCVSNRTFIFLTFF